MDLFADFLKVNYVHNTYLLTWLDPDGNIRQERVPSRLIQQSFAKVLRKLLNGGFGFGTEIFFGERKPRKELKAFILSYGTKCVL